MVDLTNKRFVIFGLQGSGKSILAKSILRTSKDHLVYDPLNEYKGFTRYVPQDRQSVKEFNDLARMVIKKRTKLFVVDEANKYIPTKPKPLPSAMADLNDLSRHWGISWGCICRRPVQFHQDVTELAHYLFIFRLKGKNDRAYLNDLADGLGDTVSELKDFHFVVVNPDRSYDIHQPVKLK